jgi:hypothetical protein
VNLGGEEMGIRMVEGREAQGNREGGVGAFVTVHVTHAVTAAMRLPPASSKERGVLRRFGVAQRRGSGAVRRRERLGRGFYSLEAAYSGRGAGQRCTGPWARHWAAGAVVSISTRKLGFSEVFHARERTGEREGATAQRALDRMWCPG